jgi:outer membrane protein TolC
MEHWKKRLASICLAAGLLAHSGCSSFTPANFADPTSPIVQLAAPAPVTESAIRHALFEPDDRESADLPIAAGTELSAEALIEQVLARNPSLDQMTAAWQAAAARYPQVTSLDDPMFGAMLAPLSIGRNDVDLGGRLEVSQKFPFPGKLRLRGQASQAEASAAGRDIHDMRLQLVEGAKHALAEYYLVQQALDVSARSLSLLAKFRQSAKTRYENKLVPQQDFIQADVEIGRQQERQLTLERMKRVATARLNTLMHQPPDGLLPPAPRQLAPEEILPDVQVLRDDALARRPDLQKLADQIAGAEASLALARKEYYPDFEVMAAYDSMMGNGPTRPVAPQIGVRMNLPVRTARRSAAIAEAQTRIAQLRAQLASQTDQVRFQVTEAYAQARESEKIVLLYQKTILPRAEEYIEAAQSAYETGKIPFLSLIEAQRARIGLFDRYYEAIADRYRRRATLERVTGGPVSLPVRH